MSGGTEVIINTTRVEAQIVASGLAVSLLNDSVTETMVGLPGPAGPAGANGVNGANGLDGAPGVQGPAGADGTNGAGLPVGGQTGQVTVKKNGTDYDVDWFSGLTLDPLTGRIGVGTNAPQAQFDIDAVGTAQTGLSVSVDEFENVFNYKADDGSSLFRAWYDSSNFHHFFGRNLYYNLAGKSFTISGNGNIISGVQISDGASLLLDPGHQVGAFGIEAGARGPSYATASVPLTSTRLLRLSTWAWNGTNGFTIAANLQMAQTQRSAAPGDALFSIGTLSKGILHIDLLNEFVGIGVNAPTTPFHVNGAVRLGSYTVATVPSAISTGEGAMIYVTDETGGPVMAFSDGASWRRMTDRGVIS
jgi:hypothetical protein